MIHISPSVLAADFTCLGQEACRMAEAGAEMLHLDVMDGHFVPNLSLGLPLITSLRKAASQLFDVHLMISNPLQYLPAFAQAGADLITFHIEAEDNPGKAIDVIHNLGKKAGLAVKPGTPAQALLPYLSKLDMVLVMTVEPGFGGQKFMPEMMDKVSLLRREITAQNLSVWVQVDGGINCSTAPIAISAGADVLVAGSALFSQPDYGKAVAELRHATSLQG